MSWLKKAYKLTGESPLLMHNGQLAAPSNKWSKAMKAISSKRAKTDADYEELARLEYMGGLYLNQDGPVIPADNVISMIIRAARKRKQGKLAEAGIFCDTHYSLEYDGPRTPEELYKSGEFIDQRGVVISRSRIIRTRPRFDQWQAVVTINYNDEILNAGQLDDWMDIAGSQIGLGDYRPQYGRFVVERL